MVDIENDLPTLDDFLQQAFADAEVDPEDRMYSILRKMILDDDAGKIFNVVSVKKKRDNDPSFLEFRGINSLLTASNVNSDSSYEKHRKKAKGYFANAKALYYSKNNLKNARKLDYILERFDDLLFTLEAFYERLRDYVEEAEENAEQNQEASGIPEHYLPKKTTARFPQTEFYDHIVDGRVGIGFCQKNTNYLNDAEVVVFKIEKDMADYDLVLKIRNKNILHFSLEEVGSIPALTEDGINGILKESYYGAIETNMMKYAEIIRQKKDTLSESSLDNLVGHVKKLANALNKLRPIDVNKLLTDYCGLPENNSLQDSQG